MRLGTIAFLLGIIAFQLFTELPDARWGLLLFAAIPLAATYHKLRIPIFFLCGFLWTLIHATYILSYSISPQLESKDVIVEGVITSIPLQRNRGVRFEFIVEQLLFNGKREQLPGRIRLNWYGYVPPLSVGDRWRLTVRLKRPYGFMNPGGFDYEGWLYQQRIRATGYVRKHNANQLLNSNLSSYPLQRLRQQMSKRIQLALADNQFKGLIMALAIGERHDITSSQWNTLTRTGISHLVAISGLHIGLVAGLIFFLVRWLWSRFSHLTVRWPAPQIAAVIALVAALTYAALAGFSIPTQRALIMVTVVMLSILMKRQQSLSHTLLLALLLVLLIDPISVMAPGFWLSYSAVAVILYCMTGRLKATGIWWKWGRLHVLIAIGLLPLMLLLFQSVPLLSPLANFIAVPWFSLLIVPLTLLGMLFLMVFPVIGNALLEIAVLGVAAIWPIMEWLSALTITQWSQPAPKVWALMSAMIGTVILLAPHGIPGRWLGIIWLLPVLLLKPDRPAQGDIWFTLLDVGQGLAAVVQTHDHVLVYDTGPRFSERFDTGKAVIVPFLKHHGLAAIDTLVIGHGDNDHIGGAKSLHSEINVGQVLSSVPEKIAWRNAELCRKGQHWSWDGVEFDMLHPPQNLIYKGNNASCVLRISNSAGTVLLTGDIENRAEKYLIDNRPGLLASDILVAPHHGSKTSSSQAFIEAVNPDTVLFPAGYRNRYGFPKQKVVARYEALNVEGYTSAKHGAIMFKLTADGVITGPETHRQLAMKYWHTR